MSDVLRTPAPPSFAALTLRELARRMHQAERDEDDILLLEVDSELCRREWAFASEPSEYTGQRYPAGWVRRLFMEWHGELWRTEFKPKKG